MFSHLSGYMGENIALASEIDAKHRARQHLGDGAFGNDLRFFRHGVNIMPNGNCSSEARVLRLKWGLLWLGSVIPVEVPYNDRVTTSDPSHKPERASSIVPKRN